MKQDEVDRVLSGELGIEPSPGFASRVMYAVQREASAPPPIPFPWKRAMPGLVAGALALIALIVAMVQSAGRAASDASTQGSVMQTLLHAVEVGRMYGIGWILLTILVTLGCVTLSMRLTAGTRTF